MVDFIVRVWMKGGAHGLSGLEGQMVGLIRDKMEEVLEVMLRMILQCGHIPQYWQQMLRILAPKPKKPIQKLILHRPLDMGNSWRKLWTTS